MIIFGFIFILVGLLLRNIAYTNVSFLEWDEGIYSQIAKEVLNGNILPTTFNGNLWLEKPPLVPGLLAFVFRIFGESEFWARMLTVSLALLLSVLVYLLTKKILKDLSLDKYFKLSNNEIRFISFLPALATISSPLVIERSTNVSTDLFLAVGWVGYFLFRKSFLGRLIFTLIGVGSKSLFGFYPLILHSMALVLWRKPKELIQNILIVAISSSWYIWGYLKYGNTFIDLHFYDQFIKRATAPIELHFGGRLYYPRELWNNLGELSIFIILGYLFILLFSYRQKLLTKLKEDRIMYSFMVFFLAFPFFIFLIFTKSKLYWYLLPLIPFFLIPIGFFSFFIKDKKLRHVLLLGLFVFFMASFATKTYLLKPFSDTNPKIALAKCLSKEEGDISFLVDGQERQNRNVLEAAHLQITNSFIYGGSPSFVFYVKKHVEYYYDVKEFSKKLGFSKLVVLSKKDIPVLGKKRLEQYSLICQEGDLLGYRSSN